jgi:hypothetical protein
VPVNPQPQRVVAGAFALSFEINVLAGAFGLGAGAGIDLSLQQAGAIGR